MPFRKPLSESVEFVGFFEFITPLTPLILRGGLWDFLLLNMLNRPVAEPPEDTGADQGEEPLRSVYSVNDDLGDDGGEDDGNGGAGDSAEESGENLH